MVLKEQSGLREDSFGTMLPPAAAAADMQSAIEDVRMILVIVLFMLTSTGTQST